MVVLVLVLVTQDYAASKSNSPWTVEFLYKNLTQNWLKSKNSTSYVVFLKLLIAICARPSYLFFFWIRIVPEISVTCVGASHSQGEYTRFKDRNHYDYQVKQWKTCLSCDKYLCHGVFMWKDTFVFCILLSFLSFYHPWFFIRVC